MTRSKEELRRWAGEAAGRFVLDGMILGVGSGRTTGHFIEYLGEKYRRGELKHISAVPTSIASENHLRQYGVPITSLADHPDLDLAVDGADEVDKELNLIKGLGRALLREKIVEIHATRLIIVVDETKIVERLGMSCPLPVEILPFQAKSHINWLNTLGCRAELWLEEDGSPAVTDNGNYLARLWFEGGIPDVYQLDNLLNKRPGVLEHGLFLQMATEVIISTDDDIRYVERKNAR
jgi:ribose 5-phosphate isomerase A